MNAPNLHPNRHNLKLRLTGMKLRVRFLLHRFSFLFLLCSSIHSIAQSTLTDSIQNNFQSAFEADSFLLKLPSIEILIDSAIAHAPVIKVQNLSLQKNQLDLKHSKNEWTKDIINAGGIFSYGQFYDINNSDISPVQQTTSASAQTRYSLGLTLKIPIISFFDRYDYKVAKIELEQTQSNKQLLIKEIREEVYNRYNSLISSYQNYKILFENFDDQNIIMENAEKDFMSNQISVSETSSLRISYAKAKIDLSKARYEFQKALWLLEEITGFRIR
jgi:outer membrane protein TolC